MHESSTIQNLQVIYEDNHLIAINKRSGDIVQGDKTGDIPLSEIVKQYLKEKYQKPGDVFLGVAHRLDRPVTGVVLFAKTSKALERVNKMFSTREMHKTYWAIVRNTPNVPKATLVHWLVKNEQKNVTKAYTTEVKNGLRAELKYTLCKKAHDFYWLEIEPLTGRPHQIRVQLSAINCPIVGDNKYGYPRANKDRSICLHARLLSFIHPVSLMPIRIEAPIPNDAFWAKLLV